MTDMNELKDILTDISFKVDGIEKTQASQAEEIHRIKTNGIPEESIPVSICPACKQELKTDYALLTHMFHKHKDWIVFSDPKLDEFEEEEKPREKGMLGRFYERNQKNFILILISLALLLIAAWGIL